MLDRYTPKLWLKTKQDRYLELDRKSKILQLYKTEQYQQLDNYIKRNDIIALLLKLSLIIT